MSSTAAIVSLAGFPRFTLFTSLPPEIRFTIWRLSLSPRVVEILASDICTGFYAQAALPAALYVCRELRQAVEALYLTCFGSFLRPERVRFNFDLDILYLDISQEEEGLYYLFGILKEIELTCLKYIAINEAYLPDGMVDFHLMKAGLKRALKAIINLKEIIVIRSIIISRPNSYSLPITQIKFYTKYKIGEAKENWPANIEELPNIQKKYRN